MFTFQLNCFYQLFIYFQRRPEYLIPWLFVHFIALVVILFGIVYAFILFVQFSPLNHSEKIIDRPDILYIGLSSIYGNYLKKIIVIQFPKESVYEAQVRQSFRNSKGKSW